MFPENIEIKIVDNLNDFASLRNDWEKLLEKCNVQKVHLQFKWVYAWLKNLCKDEICIYVVVYECEIIGLFPFLIKKIYLKKLLPIKQLCFFASPESDWHDFIIPEYKEEIISLIFSKIQNTGISEILLNNIDERSDNLIVLQNNFRELNWFIKTHTKCYYIDVRGDYNDYLKNVASYKFVQRDLPRLYNHLKKSQWRFYESDYSEIKKDINQISILHKKSQQRKKRTSNYESQKYQNFIFEVIDEFYSEGKVKLYFLEIEYKIVAFMLGFVIDNVFFWWNTGFDFNYAKLSPSKIMLNEALKTVFTDPNIKEFSFMRGDAEYKTKWANTYRNNFSIRWYNTRGFWGIVNKFRKKYI